jgi:Cupin domain.
MAHDLHRRMTAPIATLDRRPDNPAMPAAPLPWPIHPAPDPLDPELAPLLSEPFASALARGPAPTGGALRTRLFDRVATARAAAAPMVTTRLRRVAGDVPAAGVLVRTLYTAPPGRALRAGEPLRVRLVQLAAGTPWQGDLGDAHREWLVLRGQARVGGDLLGERDYRVEPAGTAPTAVSSEHGAWLFLRESACEARPGEAPFTVRDAEAGWPEFAPGIRRRVLWARDGEAALLYHAEAGAAVPHHTHGHDEECLMVQGELFLDDVLLQAGDYQLAPAGTGHHTTATDTGVVIYAHGDLDLRFVD